MSDQDRHNLGWIRKLVSMVFSALFAVLGVLGYKNSGDLVQLALFLSVAALSWGVVYLLFMGIERVLDSLDDQR